VRAAGHSPLTGRGSPAAPPRFARLLETGLDAAALIFFPLLVLAPRGVAALASVAGLFAALLLVFSSAEARLRILAGPAALFAAVIVWATASAAWSPDPRRSLEVAARLAGLFAAGLALAAAAGAVASPRRLSLSLVSGLGLGIVLAAADLASRGAVSAPFSTRVYQPAWLNQASVAFAVLLGPSAALLACIGRRVPAVLLAFAAALTVFLLAGTAAKTALVIGFSMAVLLFVARCGVARAAAAASILIVVTAPLTFPRLERLPELPGVADAVKDSAGHRLLIWSFAGDLIAEHPLAGWGLDAARAVPGGKEPIEPGETWLPLHPHNAPLQVWLELGAPGAVLFALMMTLPWLGLAEAEWPRLFAAAAGGALTTAFTACLATYGIWQEWWQGTLWFSLFVVLVMARTAGSPARYSRESYPSRMMR
jgi:O-antigen ligase